jgi:molybdate transport system ATP-binding protein
MIAVDLSYARSAFALHAAFATSARVLALYGPSGAGKTTLALLIAGLLRPDEGFVALNGDRLTDTRRGVFVKPERRRVGVLFQDALLFPHLSVRRNILFGKLFAPPGGPDFETVVDRLELRALLERRPRNLSGGEKQRVAFARALLANPRLLVLDEPTAALDPARRREILALIELMRDEFSVPIVLVSHTAEEILRVADEVVALDRGAVVARGAPANILPGASRLIEGGRFGVASLLRASVAQVDERYGITRLKHPAGEIVVVACLPATQEPIRVEVGATNVVLAKAPVAGVSLCSHLHGKVAAIDANGSPLAFVTLDLLGGDRLIAAATRLAIDELGLNVGDEAFALVKSVALDERGM